MKDTSADWDLEKSISFETMMIGARGQKSMTLNVVSKTNDEHITRYKKATNCPIFR